MTFLQWVSVHATAVNLWQLFAFVSIIAAGVLAFKMQRMPDNGVDFLQLVYEPGTSRLAPERFAYIGTWVVTSICYVFGATRPNVTADGLSMLTFTYGSLWVIGSGVKKFADRPPAPLAPPAAPAAATTVNVNPPGGQ